MLMILALVITTTMAPSVSHAMPHNGAKAEQTEASKTHDCHGHAAGKAAAEKPTQNDKAPSGKCCDKGMCKCIGNACHGGLAGIFNSGDNDFFLSSSQSQISFANEFVDSVLPNRLKRPPRA